MKILTKEEEQEHYNATVKGGLMGGVAGTAFGALGVYGASMRYPAFRGISLPFRAFLITSTGTFAAIVSADSYSRRYEASRQPDRTYQDQQASLQEQLESQKSTKDKIKQWCSENRYGLVVGSWVVSISAAMGIVGRNPYLTTAQKIVQARVYAQGFTLAAVIASLAFEGTDRMKGSGRWETVKVLDPNDPTHKHIIEKKIHHERYAGEDQWMDMVEAEEQRMKQRAKAVKQREELDKNNENGNDKKNSKKANVKDEDVHGKPTEAKDQKLNAA